MNAVLDVSRVEKMLHDNQDVSPAQLLKDFDHRLSADEKAYLQTKIAAVLRRDSPPETPVATVEQEPIADSGATDDEIRETALRLINQTDSYTKAVERLLAEFDITAAEAKDFVGLALEDSRWNEKEHSERMHEAAAEARDKELKAQAEADHLFIENYGFKNRKRIKVSPEDEEKAAKLLRKRVEEAASGPKTRLTRLDFVKKKKLYWLWQHRVPFGALSTLAGDPDQGKSLISLYLAARVSRGQKLYGNTENTEAGEVLMLCAEDDPEITIRPRLEVAGADVSKIHLLESVMLKDGEGKTFGERLAQLDTDIQAIEKVLSDNPEIKLVIVDPISSFLGNTNMNREQEVRKALQPLATRARNHGLAVVLIAHFNKNSETKSVMDRVGGAKALVSMGRAAWVCVPEPKKEPQPGQPMEIQDPDRHLFLKLKGNLAPSKVGGLVYTIRAAPVEVEDRDGRPVMEDQPFIEWLGETQDTAQEVVIEGKSKPKLTDKAKEWLGAYLKEAGGFAPSDTIIRTGRALGYSKRTIHRSREQLGLRLHRSGNRALWLLEGVEVPAVPFPA